MTVEENLDLGAYKPAQPARARVTLDEVLELFPRLTERRRQLAGTCPAANSRWSRSRVPDAAPRLLLSTASLGLSPKSRGSLRAHPGHSQARVTV